MCKDKRLKVNNSGGGNSSRHNLSLSLCHWNVEGLRSKLGLKTNDPDFVNEVDNFDIICFTETHALSRNSFSIAGYCDPFEGIRAKHPRAKKGSGGTAILVKSDIRKGIVFHHSNSPDLIWIQLKKEFFHCPSDIFIGVVYVSPINSTYSLNQDSPIWDELSIMIDKFQNIGKVILMGDFNTRTKSLADFIQSDDTQFTPVPDSYSSDDYEIRTKRLSSDTLCQPKGFVDSLLNICKSSGLRILNGRVLGDLSGNLTCHKWNGSSQVDYGIAHHSLLPLIQYFRVHDHLNHLSDHCKISLRLRVSRNTPPDKTKLFQLPTRFKWNEQSLADFKEELLQVDSQTIIQEAMQNASTNLDVESLASNISDIQVTAANTATGKPDIRQILKSRFKKRNGVRHKKWFDPDCKSEKLLLNSIGKKLVRNPRDAQLREHFFRLRKSYKGLLKRKARNYKTQLLSAMETMADQNPQQYWKLLDELKNNTKDGPTRIGVAPQDLIEHYTTLLHKPSTPDPELSETITNLSAEPFFSDIDYLITCDEVTSKIRSLKSGKAPGLDRISSEMLKASVITMVPLYTKLFNSIYSQGKYPHSWNSGYIVNIHKGGPISDPNNYRGITISNALAKVFSMILNDRLDKYLSENNILCPNQIGFKKLTRTTDHMFIIRTLIDKYVKHGNSPIFACFVDFRKAFDSVWRQALLFKLLKSNIRGKMFNIIQDMYQHDRVCLKIEQDRTDFFSCNTGVKQGDVLSPNLFNLFLNDLPSHIAGQDCDSPTLGETDINSLLYADDLVIFSLSSSGLQASLDKLNSYCQTWRLEVNIEKSKVLQCCKSGRMCNESFLIGGQTIECVQEYKYLGILFSASGSLTPARHNMHDRALKAVFKLKSCTQDSNLPPALALKLFDQVIKPVCLYGSEIWGIEDLASSKYSRINGFDSLFYCLPIETIQLSFCKHILGVSKKTTNAAVMGELGRFPLGIDVVSNVIGFWNHATSNTANPLLSKAVEVSIDLDSSGKCSWVSFLSKLLPILNENTSLANIHPNQIVDKLKRRYITSWRNTLDNHHNPLGGKLSTYRTFKSNFCFEQYLSEVKNDSHRRSLAKLRSSNHTLAIETGRYTRPITPRNERICRLCLSDEIEDECHFLLYCNTFSDLRSSFIVPFLNANIKCLSSTLQIGYFLNSGQEVIRSVAKYCHLAFAARHAILSGGTQSLAQA
jgi:hypothetical protein